MKLVNSEFVLERLNIEGVFFTYTEPESGSVGASIDSNDVEAEYEILSADDGTNFFKIVFDIHTNDRLENGYMFGCVCEGYFTFSNSDVEKSDINIYLTRSGIPAMYAHMRAILLNLTSQCSGGPLLLPTINLGDLIQKKEAKELEAAKKAAKKKKLTGNVAAKKKKELKD